MMNLSKRNSKLARGVLNGNIVRERNSQVFWEVMNYRLLDGIVNRRVFLFAFFSLLFFSHTPSQVGRRLYAEGPDRVNRVRQLYCCPNLRVESVTGAIATG